MKITSISSEEFRKNNQILYSAPLNQVGMINDRDPHDDYATTSVTYFDLNKDGYHNYPERKNNSNILSGGDPVFAKSSLYPRLSEIGRKIQTDILTQDNIKALANIKDIEIADATDNRLGAITNKRSISSLIDEVGVKANNPKWGFDLTRNEFLIYEPKK